MGTGANDRNVYLIDFGLSHNYCYKGVHISYENNVPFRGTHRYASVNAHEKVEQTRRDDLESLAYVLIYFLKGELPWQNLNIDKNNRRQVIGEIKRNIPISQITASLPDEIGTFLSIVRKLEFNEKPNYIQLRGLLQKCFYDRRFLPDGIYDWILNNKSQISIPMALPITPLIPPLKQTLPNPEIIKFKVPQITTTLEAKMNTTRKRRATDKQQQDIEWGKKPRNNINVYPIPNFSPRIINTTTQPDLSNIVRPISFTDFKFIK